MVELNALIKADINLMEQNNLIFNDIVNKSIHYSNTINKNIDIINLKTKKITQNVKNYNTTLVDNTKNIQQNITNNTNFFFKEMEKTEKKASRLTTILKKLGGAVGNIQNIKKGMEIADQFVNTTSRLNQVNDGTQSNKDFQNSIFKSADHSRTSYDAMANSVAGLGIGASGSFKNNNDLVTFTELAYKSFGMGSSQDQQSGVEQLIQAMSANGGKGGDFSGIIQNSPMIASALTSYTGKSMDEILKLAEEGKITAAVIKNAMFSASDDINSKFADKPRTFADIFRQIGDKALMAFVPVIEKVSSFISIPGFSQFITILSVGFNALAGVVTFLLDTLSWLFGLIASNWSSIEPILVIAGAVLAAWAYTQIPVLIGKLNAMIISIRTMGNEILSNALKWIAGNWPIVLIMALIGLLIYAIINFGDTVVQVIGIVGGIFSVLFAFIANQFIGFANNVVAIAEFFVNVWRDPVYAVKKLFFDLAINSLKFLLNIANGIQNILSHIPGLSIDITGNMKGLLDTLESERDNLKSDKDVIKLKKFEKQIDYSTAFEFGDKYAQKGGQVLVDKVQGIYNKVSNVFQSSDSNKNSLGLDYDKYMENGAVPVTPKDGSLNVDMSGEDLKYLKDIAEREYINQYSAATLAPNLNISFGNVTKEADVDKLVGRIQKILNEELAVVSEGVY
jgi:tape measure domain-containing protein